MTGIIRTEELTGAALDWAVGMALGLAPIIYPSTYGTGPRVFVEQGSRLLLDRWKPSEDWSQGGPLIERFSVDFEVVHGNGTVWARIPGAKLMSRGPTHLVALCRAIVSVMPCTWAGALPAELAEHRRGSCDT